MSGRKARGQEAQGEEATKPSGNASAKTDHLVSVVVPIALALIAAAGVVLGPVLGGDKNTPPAGTADVEPAAKLAGPALQLGSWGSEAVPPPPTVMLHFTGTAHGLPKNSRVVVLAEFTAADKDYYGQINMFFDRQGKYSLSPPSEISASETWDISWELPRSPVNAKYVAAAVTIDAESLGGISCGPNGCFPPADPPPVFPSPGGVGEDLSTNGPASKAVEAVLPIDPS